METKLREMAVYRCVSLEGMPIEIVATQLGVSIEEVHEICAREQTRVMEERDRGCANQTLLQLAERELHLCGERLDFLYSQAMIQRRACESELSPAAVRRSNQLLLTAARLTREKVRVTIATAKLRADLEKRNAAPAEPPKDACSPPERGLAHEPASAPKISATPVEPVAVTACDDEGYEQGSEVSAGCESRVSRKFAYERDGAKDAPENREMHEKQPPGATARATA